jgi:hypothetical protein
MYYLISTHKITKIHKIIFNDVPDSILLIIVFLNFYYVNSVEKFTQIY